MNKTPRNIIANFIGYGANLLFAAICIPFYIKLMGVEAYGLIGIFATIMAVVIPLDFGLSTTFNREFAGDSALTDKAGEMRDLLRTMQPVFFGTAVVICLAIVLVSSFVAQHWLRPETFTKETLQQTIAIMGIVVGLYWPIYLYTAGLAGLQRQALLNVISVSMDFLRFCGGVAVLWTISPTAQAFFFWQAFVNLVHLYIIAVALWSSLPRTGIKSRFRRDLLVKEWRFKTGLSGISIAALVQTQADRILLSRIFSLRVFGYYSLAAMLASGLSRIIGPIYTALFPRFTSLVARNEHERLVMAYHRGCQLMSVLVLPMATVIAVFSHEILLLWTRDSDTADSAYLIVSMLTISTALNGIAHLSYAIQLANKWTKLAFWGTVITAALMVPSLVFMALRFGPVGAACVGVFINGLGMVIGLWIMHSRFLKGELRAWYMQDVASPLAAVLGVVFIGRCVMNAAMPIIPMTISLLTITFMALLAATLAAPLMRDWLLSRFCSLKS